MYGKKKSSESVKTVIFIPLLRQFGDDFTLPAEELRVRQHMLQSAVVCYTEG